MKHPTRNTARKLGYTDSVPDDLSIQDPNNWDFRKVQDNEVEVCLWWEYARESRFIRKLQQRSLEYHEAEEMPEYLRNDFYTIAACSPYAEYVAEAATSNGPKQSFPAPWLSLKPEVRQVEAKVLKVISRRESFEGIIVHKHGDDWQTKVKPDFKPITPKPIVEFAIPYLHVPYSSNPSYGDEVAVVKIPWRRYTNRQIANAFQKWIEKKGTRPKDVPEPPVHVHETRVMGARLRDLGIMRILKVASVGEWKTQCAEAAKCYAGGWTSIRAGNARTRARDLFCRFYPFDELPLSDRSPRRGSGRHS